MFCFTNFIDKNKRGDDIKPGETIKKMFTTQHDLVYIDEIEMNFTKKSTIFGLFPYKDTFKFDKVKLTNLEADETLVFILFQVFISLLKICEKLLIKNVLDLVDVSKTLSLEQIRL